ncbi:Papain-like cysteine peptidase superfamily [Arabidopsis thaliana x Arabidopsis arenosa]|uniref:Papain-like cysteine peptidase superfamily n=1 Tax=Arabidopsis thaliana x Arabidopsis arenosa TaxID=1240361 RepID=A0A8T2A7N3_9BRAS|nr:Papain-like cysteine peptidase superfamily [Arabidopsis thaliana x Arabidopsis arenosa]
MFGLLFVVHVGILGIYRSSRIPLDYAKRVLDAEAFERFPWGRLGFKELIESKKVLKYDRTSYAIHGCPHVLNIWAFESIPHHGKSYGNKVPDDGDGNEDEDEPEPVPLLQWNGGRPRICLDNFFATEKLRKRKIKVQHLVVRPIEEIYLVWPGENDVYEEGVGDNKLVDNFLHDIMNGGLKESGFNDDPEIEKKSRKRKKTVDSEDDFVDHLRREKQRQRHEKQTSQDGFPISVVVRKAKGKGKRKAGSKKTRTTECVDPTKTSKKLVLEEVSGSRSPLKNSPLGRCIKKEPSSPKKKLTPLSEKKKPEPDLDSECSDPEEKEKDKKLTDGLDKMVELCSKKDFVPRPCRPRNLASTQLDPYIGSSIFKRIVRGKILSPAAYDPFERVTPEKMDKLESFIDHDLENPIDFTNSSAMFYLKIKTPKEQWPVGEPEYGWLTDVQLAPIMQMLWKRSMQTVYNGESPKNGKTYKKWVKDTDILYLTHNIGKDHWVAFEVNLAMRRIKVYDSICSCYSDGIKTAPQNYQTRDCGVLSAEVFDEVPDSGCFIQMSDPRGNDTVGAEFISQKDPS